MATGIRAAHDQPIIFASISGYQMRTSASDSQDFGFVAKSVVVLLALLLLGGIIWHGVSVATVERVWRNILDRPDGIVWFRFILQPLVAIALAVRDGAKDARAGRTPYLWTVLRRPEERIGRLRDGINATARVILFGVVMDVIYQVIELKKFYPVEALIVALMLAFVPYLLVRGIVTRIVRMGRATSYLKC